MAKKSVLGLVVAILFSVFFLKQVSAEEIRITGYTGIAGIVYNKIHEYFPSISLTLDPSEELRDVVVFFMDDDGSILGAYPLSLHVLNGDSQILPPVILACIQVFAGKNPVKEYRAGDGQREEMTVRHSSGLDVHKYVPIYTPFIEVVDRQNGTATIKWSVVSRNYRLCYYRFDVTMVSHRAFVPRGWVNLPFEGDGNPDVLTSGGALYVPPSGFGGF